MKNDNKIIYDVGMHKGEDSDYYLKKGFKVIGFEADPDLAEFCRQKFSNEITSQQLTIVEGAIIDLKEGDGSVSSKSKIKFFKNKAASVWGTVDRDWANRNKKLGTEIEAIEVSVVDFPACLEQYGIPYYLKIDIEGMDTVCLKSLLKFTKRPDFISIESDKSSFEKLNEEFDLFKQLGYNDFQIINQAKISSQKEPNNTKEGKYLKYGFERGATGLFGKDLNQQDWKTSTEAIKTYKRIFLGYTLLGDEVLINRFYLGRVFTEICIRLFGFPGWFDTHAKHSSIQ